ncbi:hypothetical protein GGQ54_001051 [Naumannella cuiyingiana]|uniref:Dirigent protein n=1 Tax=Naumannella cuiyingiana TaxID=1347891 RepID=A0A7Z0IKF9_9ACTN|nr:hypothetical protein [Naumannella cuiyingiana]NYI70491.1 hypothetical protein [Naumannella cuiyingiana]
MAASTSWAIASPGDNGEDATSPKNLPGVRVLNLTWKREHAQINDIAPEGFSSGDTVQFAFSIAGEKKGSADYSCTVVQANFLCDGILRLSDGDIYVSTGPVDDSGPAAIVGGTGAYFGVRGEFVKTANAEDTAGTYNLRFRR